MAPTFMPGEVTVHLQYGAGLKDCDWFKKQDPYVILKCGTAKYRSNTHVKGGTTPVWDQSFVFQVTNESGIEVEVWDKDDLRPDDCIGFGSVSLVPVRQKGMEEVQVDLFRRLSRRQQGHVALTLTFTPTARAAAPDTAPPPPPSAYSALQAAVNPPSNAFMPTTGLIQPKAGQEQPWHSNGTESGAQPAGSQHPSEPHKPAPGGQPYNKPYSIAAYTAPQPGLPQSPFGGDAPAPASHISYSAPHPAVPLPPHPSPLPYPTNAPSGVDMYGAPVQAHAPQPLVPAPLPPYPQPLVHPQPAAGGSGYPYW